MHSSRLQTPRALPARSPQRPGCIGAQTESRSAARVQARPPAARANSAAAIAGGQRAAQGRGAPGTGGLSAPLRTKPFVIPGGEGGGGNAQPGRSEQERPVKSLVSRRPCVMEKLSFGEGVGAVKSLASHLLTCMHGRRRDACVKAWFFQQTPDLDLSRKHHASVNSPPALSRFCLTAGPVSAICKTIHI